ncbi:MAG: MipA/OmpV family protein [Pseudomonadota bacterium]
MSLLRRLTASLLLCVLCQHVGAQQLNAPADNNTNRAALWEVGAGFAAASTPNYPGARGNRLRALPIPVVIYRGSFLRVGDGSVASGRLFQNERLKLDLSLNGSFDARSEDVAVRDGMPDLGFAFEIGPELEWQLSDPAVTTSRWKLELPVRAAFSLDDRRINERGFVFSPQLEYERQFADGLYEWSVSVTPSFATKALHEYFYDVAPEFATSQRPAFGASSGYLQTTVDFGLQRRGKRSFAAFGVSYLSFAGSANQQSPLFERDDGWRAGFVVVWRLWESSKRAPKT